MWNFVKCTFKIDRKKSKCIPTYSNFLWLQKGFEYQKETDTTNVVLY